MTQNSLEDNEKCKTNEQLIEHTKSTQPENPTDVNTDKEIELVNSSVTTDDTVNKNTFNKDVTIVASADSFTLCASLSVLEGICYKY